MSRSTVPLLVTIGLALGAGAPSLAAQRTETIVRTAPRAPADSLAPRLRRLERSIDSLMRVFRDDDLTGEQRLRLNQLIDERVAEFTALRMAAPRRESNVFVRVPGPVREARIAGEPFLPRFAQAAMVPGWIGIVVSGAPTQIRVENNEMFMRYLTYPEIASVDPSSPAQRAGLSPGDTLMAYNGRDVRREEISMTRLLQPKATVKVRVRRDGRVKELPVLVADAPPRIKLRRVQEIQDPDAPLVAGREPMLPRPMVAPTPPSARSVPPPSRVGTTHPLAPMSPAFPLDPSIVAGAQLVTVSEPMKRSLGLPTGVLVTNVPIGSPADESGLQEGDVIVRVGQQTVRGLLELRDQVARASEEGERAVGIELRRGKERRTLTLRW
ncbi:MAG TPA: PDZ domain-containing protein [Gemmatimonadaceae bacterium]|nr:PDZ domain-containing protein [Gemmatimonadaceae bacterium]